MTAGHSKHDAREDAPKAEPTTQADAPKGRARGQHDFPQRRFSTARNNAPARVGWQSEADD